MRAYRLLIGPEYKPTFAKICDNFYPLIQWIRISNTLIDQEADRDLKWMWNFTDFNIIKPHTIIFLFYLNSPQNPLMKLVISSHSYLKSTDLFSKHSATPSKNNSRSKSKGKKTLEVTCNKRSSSKPKI